MKESYAEIIQGIPLFQGYTVHGAERLLQAGEILDYAAGETIFKQGDPADYVLVVLSGQLEIFAERQGRHLILTQAKPGTILGELAVLGGISRSASVRVVEPSSVLKWSAETFRNMLLEDRYLSEEIFAASVRMLIDKEQALIDALFKAQSGESRSAD